MLASQGPALHRGGGPARQPKQQQQPAAGAAAAPHHHPRRSRAAGPAPRPAANANALGSTGRAGARGAGALSRPVAAAAAASSAAPASAAAAAAPPTAAAHANGASASAAPPSASSSSSPSSTSFEAFAAAARQPGVNVVPVYRRLFSDHLTPVLAYRCLVRDQADVGAPSFLLESVVNGDQTGRFSLVGARPALEVVASRSRVAVLDHEGGERRVREDEPDPLGVAARLSRGWRPATVEGLPQGIFTGGFVGYAGYDTVRYVYGSKIPFSAAPPDDRRLPDLNLALYNDVVVFDQATKIAYAISWAHLDGCCGGGSGKGALAGVFSGEGEGPCDAAASERSDDVLRALHARAVARLQGLVAQLMQPPPLAAALPPAAVDLALSQRPASPGQSNMTEAEFLGAVAEAKEHIAAGDVFQLVLSQRFERRTFADPFEIYRALRVVNPSPYMVYMQARGCVVVSSSPEILCRVDDRRVVTNRPLAGTRRRGVDAEQDAELERDLLSDSKERAEHVMLVDLGRNDVGRVAQAGTVAVERLMEVERYSHVMHISSTVTGTLRPELDAWDALRAALPAGTVSGAPKVRAMQAIDALEAAKRGPYGGGIGHVGFAGSMDMALGLRTMIIPTADEDGLYSYGQQQQAQQEGQSQQPSQAQQPRPQRPRREWAVHLQAGAGIVADSVPAAEYEETVNKAAALGRAIDLAEQAFVLSDGP